MKTTNKILGELRNMIMEILQMGEEFSYEDGWYVRLETEFMAAGGKLEEFRRAEDSAVDDFFAPIRKARMLSKMSQTVREKYERLSEVGKT